MICAPTASPGDSSYALSIIEPFLDRSRQEVIVQVFPMRKDQAGLEEFWEAAAAEVAEKVRQGNDVAFVTIGDPFLVFHLPLHLPHSPGEIYRYPGGGRARDFQHQRRRRGGRAATGNRL